MPEYHSGFFDKLLKCYGYVQFQGEILTHTVMGRRDYIFLLVGKAVASD